MSDARCEKRWGLPSERFSRVECHNAIARVIHSVSPSASDLRMALLALAELSISSDGRKVLVDVEAASSRCQSSVVRCEGVLTQCVGREGHVGAHADSSSFQWSDLCACMRYDFASSHECSIVPVSICGRAAGHDGSHVSIDGKVW